MSYPPLAWTEILPLWGRWQLRQRLTVGACLGLVPPPAHLTMSVLPQRGRILTNQLGARK
jgi:hypothetical protein